MKSIMAASGDGIQMGDGLEQLAEMGFTNIVHYGVASNREWEKRIRNAHQAGLSVIARWPHWGGLHLLGEEHAFRAYDGKHNAEGSRLEGPSVWNPEAEAVGIESLQPLVEMGIDGVLVAMLECDRPYPTDWYPFGAENQKYTTAYWCFDDHAKRAWKEHGGGEPPFEMASGSPTNEIELHFYRWYQSGWLGRLGRLTNAALGAGLGHIWTWYIPLDFWDAENMADGTADSVPGIEAWRRTVLGAGAVPVTVTPQLFGLWPRWAGPGQDTMRQAIANLDWQSIVGVGLCYSLADCIPNLSNNGTKAANLGFSGVYGGAGFLLERADEAKVAMADAIAGFSCTS